MIAERVPFANELDADQHASYVALCEDVVTIAGVAGLPRTVRDEGRAVTRAYVRALALALPAHWQAYYRAVAALLATCAQPARNALDFPAVAACARLHTFLRENDDLADEAPKKRTAQAARAGISRHSVAVQH